MKSFLKKSVAASLAALTLTAAVATASTPASAKWGQNGAFFGGLAVGALAVGVAASAANSRGPAYDGDCYIERQPVVDSWGRVVGHRDVQVCN